MGTTIRLLCFAHAGGNAAQYKLWARDLGPEVEVIPAQLPGHGNRITEPPIANIRASANEFLDLAFCKDKGRLALFGHSMGALVAFELARQLQELGCVPSWLFVSGFRAPQLPDHGPRLHLLSDDRLLEEVAAMNGTPQVLLKVDELMRACLPMIRADLTACETYIYQPSPPLKCSIAVLGGMTDPDVSREELLAWRSQTTGKFTLEMFDGGHFFVNSARSQVLQYLRSHLALATDLARIN